eukprot:scaffold19967_cov105-Skeletonema_dohrnii-CCMP3373.AAC.1
MPTDSMTRIFAAIDSIMVGKVYTSSASKQPCRWLNSAGRPLSYRRLHQYSPTHIAAAPSRLTSSFVKQARRYQDDQKPVRSSNNFSAAEAGAIQIGPAPWKP